MAPKSTANIEPGGGITALFKGPPGSGKTVGAASFPGPILFLDCDGRMAPARKMFPERKDIFYESFKPGKKGEFLRLISVLNGLEGRGDYITGVLDSLTSFGRLAVDHALIERGEQKGSAINKLGGLPIPEWPEWRFEDRALWKVMNFCRYEAGFKHFILTAHLQEIERKKKKEGGGEEGETKTYRRVVTGAQWLAAEIPAYFDEVWNFTGEPGGPGGNGIFSAVTVNLDEDSAKTALPLPKRIEFTAPKTLFGEVSRILAEQKIKLEGAK